MIHTAEENFPASTPEKNISSFKEIMFASKICIMCIFDLGPRIRFPKFCICVEQTEEQRGVSVSGK